MMKTGSQKVKRNRQEPDNLLRDPLKRNYRPTRTVFQSMAFVMETFFDALLTCSFLEDTSQWGECAIDNNKRRDLHATGSKRNHSLKLTSQSPKDNHSPMKFEPFTNPLFQSKMNNKTSKYTSPQR